MKYNIIKSETGDLTLELKKQTKNKAGDSIKKLPPAYPIIGEYEKDFQQNYYKCINKNFIKPFLTKLKEK
jgi:hypothetical protein